MTSSTRKCCKTTFLWHLFSCHKSAVQPHEGSPPHHSTSCSVPSSSPGDGAGGLRAWLCLHPVLQPHSPQQLQNTAHSLPPAQLLSCAQKGHTGNVCCGSSEAECSPQAQRSGPSFTPSAPSQPCTAGALTHPGQQLPSAQSSTAAIPQLLHSPRAEGLSSVHAAAVSGHRATGRPAVAPGSASAPTPASTYPHSAPAAMQER